MSARSAQPAGAPASARARAFAERTWAHPRTPALALAVLCLLAFAVIMRAGRGLFFFGDEWAFILDRRGLSPSVFLSPHNEHPVVVGVITYKVLLAVFGLGSYRPYLVTVALFHLVTCVLVWVYARRLLGPRLALVPAALLLFLGAAWEDVVWAFQIAFIGAALFGVLAFIALDDRRDWLACLALVGAVTSSALGLPFLLIAAIRIAWEPTRWRRAWVIAVPVIVLAIILLGYG